MPRTIDTTVSSIGSTPFTAKTGKSYNSHYVVTADGEQIEVGLKQKYAVGARINVDVDKQFGKLKEVGPPTGVPTKAEPAPLRGTSPAFSRQEKVFPVPELSGEMAIIRQNALTNAVNVVVNKSSVLLGVDKTKAEREQFLNALVEDILGIAYKFADFSSGHREAKLARQTARLADETSG